MLFRSIVNLGQSEAGGIFITASEANAPYLSVFTHDGSPWTGLDTKLRLENLNGFLGYASDTYGIGIGTSSSYLKYDPVNGLRIKGDITITGGDAAVTFVQEDEPGSSGDPGEPKAGDIWYVPSTGFSYVYVEGSGASFTWETMSSSGITDSDGKINQAATPAGAGLYLGSSYMGYYSGAAWTSYIKSDGSFQFTGDASNKIVWDGATLAITGVITCGASSSYAGASIATSYTAAKCTDALADQTSVNTSSDTSAVGGLTASKIAGWAHTSDTTKIDGGDIYTNTVTATQINVTQLDALTVNTGTLNVDEAIKSGQTAYDTGAGFWMEYNSGTPRFSIGNASANKFLWDGTNVSVTGTINATAGAFSGGVDVGGTANVQIDGSDSSIKVFGDTVTIEVDVNDMLDWKENSTTHEITIDPDDYTPALLAAEVQAKMRLLGDNDTTVTYSSVTRLITIANSTLSTFEIYFYSGVNTVQTIGQALGFDVTIADQTGALTYTSAEEIALRVKIGLI